MWHDMPVLIEQRMRMLEAVDARDRQDGTPRRQRVRQIPPETGKFIALMAAAAPAGRIIEIGTSAGYSTLWLSLAGRERGERISTFEILDAKVRLAQETFRLSGVEDIVELIAGDALDYLPDIRNIAFCFLDAEKEIYDTCYEAIVPNMVSGGLLVADNAINHRATLQPMIERSLRDERVDALIVPIGKGELVCRKR